MSYLNRIVPAQTVLRRSGTVVIWTNCRHPYYDANPFPALCTDPTRAWVGDWWPLFYAGHTIELANLKAILAKAAAHAESRKLDPLVLTGARLYPDMFPLFRQVQIACDTAKNSAARLAGVEPPKHEDTEQSFPELQARIDKALAYVRGTTAAQIDGGEERAVKMPAPGGEVSFRGEDYLLERGLFRRKSTGEVINERWLEFSFPHWYHYDILRALDYLRAAEFPLDDRLARTLAASRWQLTAQVLVGGDLFTVAPLLGGRLYAGSGSHYVRLLADGRACEASVYGQAGQTPHHFQSAVALDERTVAMAGPPMIGDDTRPPRVVVLRYPAR